MEAGGQQAKVRECGQTRFEEDEAQMGDEGVGMVVVGWVRVWRSDGQAPAGLDFQGWPGPTNWNWGGGPDSLERQAKQRVGFGGCVTWWHRMTRRDAQD